MTDTDVILIGRLLRELQAQMRTQRDETRSIREELTTKATREEMFRFATIIADRFSELETRMDIRFDQLVRTTNDPEGA